MKTILVDAADTFIVENQDGTFSIFKEMQEILDQYPNRKILLSGADDEQYKEFGLADMPYEVFTLKHNPEKTDPEYYRIMLKHYGLGPTDVVYFEHNPEAVKAVASVGIKTMYYDPGKKDLKELKKFIESNL